MQLAPSQGLTHYLARTIWWAMLWLMRRRPIKTLQRKWLGWVGPAAHESLKAQNRWARRYGLTMVRVAVAILLASILITICSIATIHLYEAGAFQGPPKD